MRETDLFFKELFVNVYRLSLKSEISIKAENVTVTINILDELLPEILISKSDRSMEVMKLYNEIREEAFKGCFKLIAISIEQYIDNSQENHLLEIKNILLMLTRLGEMKYFMTYVHCLSRFLWNIFCTHRCHPELRRISLCSLSNISVQLVRFLLWPIDSGTNNEQFRDFALEIFDSLKTDLINGELQSSSEIVYVLNILDVHDRFIGQYIDAVPENVFFDGYVLCSLHNGTLENDDVYEDYEQFSSTHDD